MIDVGIITGSGIYELPGEPELRAVETRFGTAEVAVTDAGPWRVGGIARHGKGHRHLSHTVPHRTNLAALAELGARAVLATTAVGAVDPELPLGRPVVFDDLFFPGNHLPDGGTCTIFDEPGARDRGHLIWTEPFSPRLRSKLALAAEGLGLDVVRGGVYGHTNGPRFETRAEIRSLAAAGVAAVSQTCGPEAVLAGELGLAYGLVGFPVNHATGVASRPESPGDLARRLARAAEVLPGLVLRAAGALEEEDLVPEGNYVYRIGGG